VLTDVVILLRLQFASDAVSPVSASQVLTALIAFVVVYGLLGVTGFYLIAKNALNGPEELVNSDNELTYDY
jgi:cytochrome d ubiquinol oxidase subunit I